MSFKEIITKEGNEIIGRKTTKKTLDRLFFEIQNENEQELTAIPLIDKEPHIKELIAQTAGENNSKTDFDTFIQETPCNQTNSQLTQGKHHFPDKVKTRNQTGHHRSNNKSCGNWNLHTNAFNKTTSKEPCCFFKDANFSNENLPLEQSEVLNTEIGKYYKKIRNLYNEKANSSASFSNTKTKRGQSTKMISDYNSKQNAHLFQRKENPHAGNSSMRTKVFNRLRQSRNEDSISGSLLLKTTMGKTQSSFLIFDTERQRNLRHSMIRPKPNIQNKSTVANVITLLDKIKYKCQDEERMKVTNETFLLNEILFLKEQIKQLNAQKVHKRPNSFNSQMNTKTNCSHSHTNGVYCLTDNNITERGGGDGRERGLEHERKKKVSHQTYNSEDALCKMITELGLKKSLLYENKSFFNDPIYNSKLIQIIKENQEIATFIKFIVNHFQT